MSTKLTRQMLKIYKPYSDLDWMNYRITKKNKVTYHHIQKAEEDGEEVLENGALLMPTAHEYLHIIEAFDIESYVLLNKIFKAINSQGKEPTLEQRKMLELLLLDFEVKFKDKKKSNGKPVLKYEYTIRNFENSLH